MVEHQQIVLQQMSKHLEVEIKCYIDDSNLRFYEKIIRPRVRMNGVAKLMPEGYARTFKVVKTKPRKRRKK